MRSRKRAKSGRIFDLTKWNETDFAARVFME